MEAFLCSVANLVPERVEFQARNFVQTTELNINMTFVGPRVGYMPQELALYGEFTIRETLQYFGR